ncbi:SGNH/GDSL hydrolase family protein [Cryobacterium psychrophilum]|uniref:SGNH/GDSL hydrolase family protein n=1 Tax=Cryobacterium psychrophilum TaxID=41988 RepID=A0A4Y8KLQ0_9MICO|nr:SGNH/GDSL hydrolase family protein [Cryobacterium psychrophilum]TDW31232.1 lysophospholipase L1-like esterase [Cryobacterium psychrophilum]TFD78477.1 SGNH/GDSL hydrolase family protein [Cryobacterium psychrophilum]
MTTHRFLPSRLIASVVGAAVVAVMAACAPTPIPAVQAFPDGPTVAFYGDSYTRGTGASDPSKRWSSLISTERGWNEVNPSANGLGFINKRSGAPGTGLVQQVIDAKPDIVMVTMGLNDNFSMPGKADAIEAAITTDLSTLATALPEARIVVVEPFWYTDERPSSVATIISWVRDAAAGIDADYIEDASHWIEGHPEWMAGDGLHPNDAGYAAMATRMDAELSALGL